MSSAEFNIIFLFGAGASLPAGLPVMKNLTDEFFDSIPQDGFDPNILKKINTIKVAAFDFFRERNDIESMMTLIKRMEDATELEVLSTKYPELGKISAKELKIMTDYIQNFIRERLENVTKQSISYLEPMYGFLSDGTLEFFTLNYDGILDLFLENNDIEYSDGFLHFGIL